jgi:hypothetical protein
LTSQTRERVLIKSRPRTSSNTDRQKPSPLDPLTLLFVSADVVVFVVVVVFGKMAFQSMNAVVRSLCMYAEMQTKRISTTNSISKILLPFSHCLMQKRQRVRSMPAILKILEPDRSFMILFNTDDMVFARFVKSYSSSLYDVSF